MRALSTVFVLLAFWGMPAFALIVNRLKPSVGNALGVPYGFLIGFALGLLAMIIVAVASHWVTRLKPSYAPLLVSAVLTFFLFLVADQGLLSKFP